MKLIAQAAEAKIYKDGDQLIKHRIKKSYRINELDERLRRSRTKREAKIIKKLNRFGFTPNILESDSKEKLVMDYIEGDLVKNVLEQAFANDKQKLTSILRLIGKQIKIMHDNNIIHGDLTTSNMIVKQGQVYFIDFGLSFVSTKVEDKAVDLHLLKQALESKHYSIWQECFKEISKTYKNKDVLRKLVIVEQRGRNKKKHTKK